ncbi:MAG: glycosyltransferase family 4 protein [Miltoncostaeaceae bacterium]
MPEASSARARVLWLTTSLQPGGAERNIVSVMPHMGADDVSVALCTLMRTTDGPLAEEFASTGLRRFDLGARRLADPPALARLVRLLRRGRIDLIHAHDQYGSLMGGLAGSIARVPVVMSRHVLADDAPHRRGRLRARLAVRALERWAEAVIAVSGSVRGAMVRDGVSEGRIAVVHNGIDRRPFDVGHDRVVLRASLGVAASAPLVVMPAVLRPGKGHEVLVEAAARLAPTFPDLVVALAGEGPLRNDIAAAAAAVPSVRLLGHRSDIPALLAACDLAVLPSFAEGLPTVLIEAAFAGRPVVASDGGGAGEIVDDGRTGLLVPAGDAVALADAIGQVLGDAEAAGRMGSDARALAEERFSLARQAEATRAVYRSVLAP